MAKKAKASKKSNVLNVNFEGVESSGKHPEGRFVFAVDEVEVRNSTNSGNDYLSFKLKSAEGVVFYNASLASHALWNFKNFLEAAGQEVPDGEMEIDLDELKELEVGAEIIHEKYEGKTRSVVAEIVPVADVDEDSGNTDEDEGDDEGEEHSYESVQEMDLEELLEVAEENDIKVSKKQQKKLNELRDFICEQLELEEDDGEEEGEEEDHTYESVQEMDADDLDEVCEENDIKVTAKIKKKLALYRNAVCEALELEEEEEEEEEEEAPTKGKKGSKSKK